MYGAELYSKKETHLSYTPLYYLNHIKTNSSLYDKIQLYQVKMSLFSELTAPDLGAAQLCDVFASKMWTLTCQGCVILPFRHTAGN